MTELAERLGLKVSSIYKWHWDRSQTVNKRFEKNLRKINKANKLFKGGEIPKVSAEDTGFIFGNSISNTNDFLSLEKVAAEKLVEPNVLTEILL